MGWSCPLSVLETPRTPFLIRKVSKTSLFFQRKVLLVTASSTWAISMPSWCFLLSLSIYNFISSSFSGEELLLLKGDFPIQEYLPSWMPLEICSSWVPEAIGQSGRSVVMRREAWIEYWPTRMSRPAFWSRSVVSKIQKRTWNIGKLQSHCWCGVPAFPGSLDSLLQNKLSKARSSAWPPLWAKQSIFLGTCDLSAQEELAVQNDQQQRACFDSW